MFYYLVIRHQTAIRFAYFCEKKIEKKLFSRNESGLKIKRFSMLNWNYFAKNSKKCKKVESECDDVHSIEICQIPLIIPFFCKINLNFYLSMNRDVRQMPSQRSWEQKLFFSFQKHCFPTLIHTKYEYLSTVIL